MTISYSVIFFEFDPKTDTDLVYTRLELEPTLTLDESVEKQAHFLSMVKSQKSYRSYIQERENCIVKQSPRKVVTRYRILGISNIIERRL